MEDTTKKKVGRPSNVNKEKEMLKRIAELEEQIKTTSKNISSVIVDELDEEVDVRLNKYIKVMSLNFGLLNLTTETKGRGKIFKFPHFGDVRNIVYADLANIIHTNQKFAEEGRFYIFNKQVVKNHGLLEYYDKFMTKEMIEKILDYDKEKMIDLFKNTTKTQQDIIVQILIKKIKQGEDIDLNKVDSISRLIDFDIYEAANEYQREEK